MAFNIATNNRFDLFVEEDNIEDADELLTRQQRQVDAERQRRDNEKKQQSKLKSSSRSAPGKAQTATQPTVARPVPNNSTTVKTASSTAHEMASGAKRYTGKLAAAEAASKQDVLSFRERSDVVSESRGGGVNSSSYRRGRGGGGRGGYMPATDDGFDRFGKREFERHSGSDKTGLKAVDKRSGRGAHNWGNITDDVKSAEDSATQTSAEKETRQVEAEVEESDDSLRQLTLDEWRALQGSAGGSRPTMHQLKIRRPGEGCARDPRWNQMEVLRSGTHDDSSEQPQATGQFDDADEESGRTQKSTVVQIPVTFSDSDRHSGRGHGRGNPQQQQRVSSRSQTVTATMTLNNNSSDLDVVPNVDSEQDFPSLS